MAAQTVTKHWARKIKTVFRRLDTDNDGYLTEEGLDSLSKAQTGNIFNP